MPLWSVIKASPNKIPNKVRVKICGITNLPDAIVSLEAGADALGFIFATHSKRFIAPEKVRPISLAVGPCLARVGVFVAADTAKILRHAETARISALQLHGQFSPSALQQLAEWYPIIRVLTLQQLNELSATELAQMTALNYTMMLDAPQAGSGQTLDWQQLRDSFPAGSWLAGGLGPHNIREAIDTLQAVGLGGVDAVSRLEIAAGQKDHKAVKNFINIAKSHPKYNAC